YVRLLFVACSRAIRALHSFPTRRSSDLGASRELFKRARLAVLDRQRAGDPARGEMLHQREEIREVLRPDPLLVEREDVGAALGVDRKSTRLNSSHVKISYAVFCLKKKTG